MVKNAFNAFEDDRIKHQEKKKKKEEEKIKYKIIKQEEEKLRDKIKKEEENKKEIKNLLDNFEKRKNKNKDNKKEVIMHILIIKIGRLSKNILNNNVKKNEQN